MTSKEKDWSDKIRSQRYLAHVREHGCLICQRPAQAHHLTFTDKDNLRGMRRTSDADTVPLCDDHHRHLHAYGNEQRWWAMQGIDPLMFTDATWKQFND